jgi:hypothetical protein
MDLLRCGFWRGHGSTDRLKLIVANELPVAERRVGLYNNVMLGRVAHDTCTRSS